MNEDVKKALNEGVLECKELGIEVSEEILLKLSGVVFRTADKVIVATPNPVDDLLRPAIPFMQKRVNSLIDEIDGEKNA